MAEEPLAEEEVLVGAPEEAEEASDAVAAEREGSGLLKRRKQAQGEEQEQEQDQEQRQEHHHHHHHHHHARKSKGGSRSRSRSGGRKESYLVRYEEAYMNFILMSSGLSMLALFAENSKEVAMNLGGMVGPFALFSLTDFFKSGRDLPVLHTFVFATAAAGLAGLRFGGGGTSQELLFLNVSGAFLNAFLKILISNHNHLHGGESIEALEIFQGAFTGVWTSFAGLVIMAGQDFPNFGQGLLYFALSMVAGAAGHETGLRLGGRLNETVLSDDEGRSLPLFSKWLPYGAAYVSAVTLIKGFSQGTLFSFIYSFLGYTTGSLTVISAENNFTGFVHEFLRLSNDLVFNTFAVLLVIASRGSCKVAAVRKPVFRPLCASPAIGEFEAAYAGAASTFCGSAEVVHSFFLSLVPEDVKDDVYYDPGSVGANSMRELGVELSSGGSKTNYALALGTRIMAEVSLVILAFSANQLIH